MSGRYPIADDPILTRWMRLEMGKLNDGIVSERKSLAQLLTGERPVSRTRSGKEHVFDSSALKELSERLPPDLHDKLKLPVIFFSDTKVPDSCYLNDPNALSALQILEELSEMRQMQQGKMWVGKSIAYSIMRKYPTVVQIAMR
ncbi:DUF61 family protein [Methanolobus profundi]|uniref:DUF61 family protein n=1 Tax=Methanolobus profundi TaxID=487685 RepID=A0A1I4T1A8_9EURY|nr:DUF61 family protein [Methanolobus profundi]SFM70441.1 hypothetical protein SAMN04488696_2127 [Methanolobus profundi]